MRDVCIDKDEMLVRFDISSLLTNVPVDEAMKVIHRKLQQNKTLEGRTVVSPDRIVELYEICLRSIYFSYDGFLTTRLMLLLYILLSHQLLPTYTWSFFLGYSIRFKVGRYWGILYLDILTKILRYNYIFRFQGLSLSNRSLYRYYIRTLY